MYYHILYTLETLRCYFPDNVICPIDIGIDELAHCRTEEPTLDALAHVQVMLP